jgi:prepilin-type N-terminal cleavage/methylation domain-containing protein
MVPMASQAVRALRPTSPPKGFSLLETLVVVAILGLLMAVAGLSLFQVGERKFRTEGDRIAAVVVAVSDRAAIMQRDHRLIFDRNGFRIEEQRRGQWIQQAAFPMQPRQWNAELYYQGEPVVVRVDRTGLVQPVRLPMVLVGQAVVLVIDPAAQARLERSINP